MAVLLLVLVGSLLDLELLVGGLFLPSEEDEVVLLF